MEISLHDWVESYLERSIIKGIIADYRFSGDACVEVWMKDFPGYATLISALAVHLKNCTESSHDDCSFEFHKPFSKGAGRADGSNYTANDDTFPTEIVFASGRRVGIAFDGDKPYLTVSPGGVK